MTPKAGARVEIFYVTYDKDARWFNYSVRSARKYTSGFSGITAVAPRAHAAVFEPICADSGVKLALYDEDPERGHLHHNVVKCSADTYCPDADFVLHVDSDCVFFTAANPDDYFVDAKPVLLCEPYENFRLENANRYSWKDAVERALGFPTPYETMVRHPAIHRRDVYGRVRRHIEALHGVPFERYVLAQKPTYPCGFCEFNTLGGYAKHYLHDDYHFIDVTEEPRPADKLKAYWSHGGISSEIRHEIETILGGSAEAAPVSERCPVALTSFAPGEANVAKQRACIASWRKAGLDVRAFNHPSDIARMKDLYDVTFVPVTDTTEHVFGKRYVPIHSMLRWATTEGVTALLINADIELCLAPWEMKRIRWLAEDGLCYFVRHNHDGRPAGAALERHGIDAFLVHGRDADMFSESFLSMGQPFWDYWLPFTFAARRRPLFAVEFPAALHRNHPMRWTGPEWHRCAEEFDRVVRSQGDARTGVTGADSWGVRMEIERARSSLRAQPEAIRSWVERTFADDAPKTFLELGAHQGTDTAWMARIPGVTLHAFEPDPRNDVPSAPNVIVNRAAVAGHDGRCPLTQSAHGWGVEWTHSSSIRRPKNHLSRYPVTFGATIEVEAVTLDQYCRRHGLGPIDFVWADVQGAEGDMVDGGWATLARTRYLFTAYSDEEMYEGQIGLAEMLRRLPGFRVVEMWDADVLLANTRIAGPSRREGSG
jgi:FkbM family methyltransferase